MDTIDYKQKIKDYMNSSDVDTLYKSMLNNLFPELKEGEDERIRKHLIGVVELYYGNTDEQEKKDCLAWLEKQGKTFTKKDVDDAYLKGLCLCDAKHELEKPADKVEPKFNVGDVMRTLQEASNNITSGLPVVVSIDNEYYHCTNELIAIKDQNNYEYPPINRIQKPAWSEEDEEIHRKCICAMRASACGFPEEEKFVEQVDNWLKSLRPQNTWKPSEIQLETLKELSYDVPTKRGVIEELLKHLKQL